MKKLIILFIGMLAAACNWGNSGCDHCSCGAGCCDSGSCDTEACACDCKS